MKFMSVNEVAETLSVNRTTVSRLIKSGKLHAIKVNTAVRIAEDSLQDFVRQNSINENKDNEEFSTAKSIMKHLGKWDGPREEFDIILKAIKDSRSNAEF